MIDVLESLDQIHRLVEDKFQEIRNTDRSCFHFPGQPCGSAHLQVRMVLVNFICRVKGPEVTLHQSSKEILCEMVLIMT